MTTPFCDTIGTEVDDSMSLGVYLEQLNEEKKPDAKEDDNDQGDDDQDDANEEEVNAANKKSKEKVGQPAEQGKFTQF